MVHLLNRSVELRNRTTNIGPFPPNDHIRADSPVKMAHNSIINNRLQLSSRCFPTYQDEAADGMNKVKCFHCGHDYHSKRMLQEHQNKCHQSLKLSSLQRASPQITLNMVMKREPGI